MQRDGRLRQLLNSAEQHTRAGRLRRAVAVYRRVLAMTQDGEAEREIAHARLGDLHLGQGRPQIAVPHLRRAQVLSGGEPEYALMLGKALLALGRPGAATEVLHGAVGSARHAADALAELARASEASGDRNTARVLAGQAAARDLAWAALARGYCDA
jgi:predicted Zn-dependent protease